MKELKKQLIELLNIHGVSGNENKVREYLVPVLSELTDDVFIDGYGNLLAEKKCGDGIGATIMLSAHMDTVRGVLKDRKLIENEGIIRSSKGALGADDRAGIAIILTVLRNIGMTKFNGTIKVAFSREEEVGCVGASKMNKSWYKDVDLAIVVDRKGSRDIVVGCFGAFCSDNVGIFMEGVSSVLAQDWACVEGGISDAVNFSSNGINSINLSAGYYNEHTEKEYVVLQSMKETTQLILQSFELVNSFYKGFGKVPNSNKWVKQYIPRGNYGYYEDDFDYYYDDEIWAEVDDKSGDVYLYGIGEDIVLQQGVNEITMSKESLDSLIKQLTQSYANN